MLVIAHRMPANSRAASALAAAGAGIFELDVRLPPGGPAVVSHFRELGPRPARLFYDGWRVRRGSCGGRLGPPLTDVLALVPPDCEALLDIKGPVADPAAARALVAAVPEPTRTHLCGNAGPFAGAASAVGIRVWRSVGSPAELHSALRGQQPPPWAITVRHNMLDEATLAALRQRAPRVVAWTVNSVARALVLRSWGVDGITTDRPAVMTALAAGAR